MLCHFSLPAVVGAVEEAVGKEMQRGHKGVTGALGGQLGALSSGVREEVLLCGAGCTSALQNRG